MIDKNEITRKCVTGEAFTPEEQQAVIRNAAQCIVEDFKDYPEGLQFLMESMERFIKAFEGRRH